MSDAWGDSFFDELNAQKASWEKRMMKVEIDRHPSLHLLAKERTGWRRWLFGRWVYSDEPFRRDIQRRIAKSGVNLFHKKGTRYFPPCDENK